MWGGGSILRGLAETGVEVEGRWGFLSSITKAYISKLLEHY
jgi:hypothetical protein